jgi:hypothetical protein
VRRVRAKVSGDLPSLQGKPLYRRSDSGLLYDADALTSATTTLALAAELDCQFGLEPPYVFVIADTLTLTFSGRDGRLVSLDAYTNEEQWTRQSVARPSGPKGALLLAESIEDRFSLAIAPEYRFDDRASMLFIGLGGRASQYFEVGDDLFIGLVDGELAEVVLINLRIE